MGVPLSVCGVAGDQQAALFGQKCFNTGDVKNTYGTGCFLLMNTGNQPVQSSHGLVTTIAAGVSDRVQYALEGSIFVAGAAIQWLRDQLDVLTSAKESAQYAQSVEDTAGTYVVPAFTGLGAPHWDMYARGTIVGITRGTKREHIIRAAQESIAYQSMDLVDAMEQDTGVTLACLKVDGGASRDRFLMQFQADMLQAPIVRSEVEDASAFGALVMNGFALGKWVSFEEAETVWAASEPIKPVHAEEEMAAQYEGWHKAIGMLMN